MAFVVQLPPADVDPHVYETAEADEAPMVNAATNIAAATHALSRGTSIDDGDE